MKKMILATLVAAVLTASLHAQSAKVIALSPADAAQAKQLREQLDVATKRLGDFTESIRAKYLTAAKEDEGHTQTHGFSFSFGGKETTHGYWVKPGWGDGGFEFSDDFKYIVPQKTLQITGGSSLGCGNWISPAGGTFTTTN